MDNSNWIDAEVEAPPDGKTVGLILLTGEP